MNDEDRKYYIYRAQCDVILECVKDKYFGYYNGKYLTADELERFRLYGGEAITSITKMNQAVHDWQQQGF